MLDRLRAARLAAGLTQVQAAEALGRWQAYVSKCELGERRMDPIDLAEFARLYALPVAALILESDGDAALQRLKPLDPDAACLDSSSWAGSTTTSAEEPPA